MFSLSRVSKPSTSTRLNAATSTKAKACKTMHPNYSTSQTAHRPADATIPTAETTATTTATMTMMIGTPITSCNSKKRRRSARPPIPSFRDEELEKLEREFLGDDYDTSSGRSTATVGILSKHHPNNAKKIKLEPVSAVSQKEKQHLGTKDDGDDYGGGEDDDDDDDSILEIKVFAPKKDCIALQRSSNGACDETVNLFKDLTTKTMQEEIKVEVNTAPDAVAACQLSKCANAAMTTTKPDKKTTIPATATTLLEDETRQRIDDILATSDFKRVSLKNIYSLLGKEIWKGRKDVIRSYVFGKLGIPTSKPSSTVPANIIVAANSAQGVGKETESTHSNSHAPSLSGINEACQKPSPTHPVDIPSYALNVSTKENDKPPLLCKKPLSPSQPHQRSSVLAAQRLVAPCLADKGVPACPKGQSTARILEIPASNATVQVVTDQVVTEAQQKAFETETKKNPPLSSTVLKGRKVAPKRKRQISPKRSCPICSQCPCRIAHESEEVTILNTSQNNLAVERALIKRLQKCQKTTERHAHAEEAVRRQLKNHRRDMWRKRERLQQLAREQAKSNDGSKSSRFLPDVDEIEACFNLHATTGRRCTTKEESDKARSKIFGERKSYQPTLTQLLASNADIDHEAQDAKEERDDRYQADEQSQLVQEEDGNNSASSNTHRAEEKSSVLLPHQTAFLESDELQDGEEIATERIDWIEGHPIGEDGRPVASLNNTLWSCILSGNPMSTWDRLFDDPASTENMGMDDLLEMLDDVSNVEQEVDHQAKGAPSNEHDRVELPMLSQRGQEKTVDLIRHFSKDPTVVRDLQSICPEWKENICFAMDQKDRSELYKALQSIQLAREKFERGRRAMENLMNRCAFAYSFFEEAVNCSMSRLDRPEEEAAIPNNQPETVFTDESTRSIRCSSEKRRAEFKTKDDICLEVDPGLTKKENNDTADSFTMADDARDLDLVIGRSTVDWVPGRKSAESDVATLIASVSTPRRSSIATCRSLMTPSSISGGAKSSIASQ